MCCTGAGNAGGLSHNPSGNLERIGAVNVLNGIIVLVVETAPRNPAGAASVLSVTSPIARS
jgi:hypothetical protein